MMAGAGRTAEKRGGAAESAEKEEPELPAV